jgi:hypothetical protein
LSYTARPFAFVFELGSCLLLLGLAETRNPSVSAS